MNRIHAPLLLLVWWWKFLFFFWYFKYKIFLVFKINIYENFFNAIFFIFRPCFSKNSPLLDPFCPSESAETWSLGCLLATPMSTSNSLLMVITKVQVFWEDRLRKITPNFIGLLRIYFFNCSCQYIICGSLVYCWNAIWAWFYITGCLNANIYISFCSGG